ncbi:MAG: hypothetical protein AAF664_06790 [Planctomycetota bacterium]
MASWLQPETPRKLDGDVTVEDLMLEPFEVTGEYVLCDGDSYFRIGNSHLMPDFFMSLVGAGNHWMFVSSNGALTAGRRNPDLALFPYAADDQISAARRYTGSKTLIRTNGQIWEPFAERIESGGIRRHLYKTPLGNKLIFEEVNEDVGLTFRYRWAFSGRFGIVRSCTLINDRDDDQSLELLDGLQNVLPYGVGSDFTMRFSNLANAYKKSELVEGSNLSLFYLSSIPTDRAEPSEGLKATVIWQSGLDPQQILLSTDQVRSYRDGAYVQTETEVRGKPGAFLLTQSLSLAGKQQKNWHVVAELAQDHSEVIELDERLRNSPDMGAAIEEDIQESEQQFLKIVSSSDGLQCGNNRQRVNRHLSNTVFNVMRGGIPLDNYSIDRDDFLAHLENFNREAFHRNSDALNSLPMDLNWNELQSRVHACQDPDLTRLTMEYLPLAFSRRHGDPTRPWNRFSIELVSEDGSSNLDYQGNWRDIFQNWEALGVSFPVFNTAMISRFVNATTADGYNPYRVTKKGFEWEEPEPNDPWSNIGYWGDHQIIYLLKLLEWSRKFWPENLDDLLSQSVFTHANVPYRIKDFDSIKSNPHDTIVFDEALASEISDRVSKLGSDGKLLCNQHGEIHRVTLLEKLLTLSLSKLSNFIPDGGIWLNTQRPEWNDANNALVGNGLSMVTTCYLYRWFDFLEAWLSSSDGSEVELSIELAQFLERIRKALLEHADSLQQTLDSEQRSAIAEALSRAGSQFRGQLYSIGFSGGKKTVSLRQVVELFKIAKSSLKATIKHNRRSDGLYHSYNLLDWQDDQLNVEYLYEMLEGQVAVLSSGLLSGAEAVDLLEALRESRLYREDQHSYILYPDRQLPRFLEKNTIPDDLVEDNPLVGKLLELGDTSIVARDICGGLHFNGGFRNSADLREALHQLDGRFREELKSHGDGLCSTFVETFGHRQFTGRSGTFFGYEGLGSIYWHMVSKLGLAVTENFFWAIDKDEPSEVIEQLAVRAEDIRRGIGAEKSPDAYGAFPSDAYSHTPEKAGVKQPGMTGQVKEDILARFSEVGIHVARGCVEFRLDLFNSNELLDESSEFVYYDIKGQQQTVVVPRDGFAFTICQVPVLYQAADRDRITIQLADGSNQTIDGKVLDRSLSKDLFDRSGRIIRMTCEFKLS